MSTCNALCNACAVDPLTHSFKKIGEKRGITIFYSKPSQAKKYDDTAGILAHVHGALASLNNKKWMCIIDGDQFDAKYVLEYQTGKGLVEMFFTTYEQSLVEIKIINPTIYIRSAMKVLMAIVSEDKLSKITLLDDKPYSILQFI